MKRFFIIIWFLLVVCTTTVLTAQENNSENEETANIQENSIIMIDNEFSDWEGIPLLARFSSYYNPYYFNREKEKKLEVHKIEDSVYWGYNGTQLKDIKALVIRNNLYFYFSTYSPIAKGLLIFLYLFQSRNNKMLNTYTLELAIDADEDNGKILLWETCKEEFIEVGISATSTKEIECMLSIDLLPKTLQTGLILEYSFDLTTCFFEKSSGMYEEYFFISMFFKDIPNKEEL